MGVFDNYACEGQLSLFDIGKKPYDIKKPIRLIEAFGGIGSQIQALKNIGANIDKGRAYKLIEIDQYAVKSYNAMHGTEFVPVDITKVKAEDLEIVDKDKYTYVFFYSFPCTDISTAGKMLGYDEDSGTRSSLLWEVRRILKECKDKPQVLICENVPQIHSKANADNFQKFIEFLDSIGYSTTYTVMNAKNYGIPQSRKRTFIVSILGNYEYHFPNPVPLEHNLNDYLEPTVDEKYYLKNDKAKELIDKLILDGKILRGGSNTELTSHTQEDKQENTHRQSFADTMVESIHTQTSEQESAKLFPCEMNLKEVKTVGKQIALTLTSHEAKGFSDGFQYSNGVIECNKI